jgi:uncharacterized protein DUF6941
VNIDWLIPCRYLEVHDNLGTLVGAGIDTFTVTELPAAIQVVIAIRLTATDDELDESIAHPVRSIVRQPNGDVLSDVQGEARVGGEAARPDWLAGIMLATVVQFEAAEEGTYAFEYIVDQSSATVPLHVVQTSPESVE